MPRKSADALTAAAARVRIAVYLEETDDSTGTLHTRRVFRRPAPIARIRAEGHPEYVTADVMDGGLLGHLTGPAGTAVVELVSGGLALEVPCPPGGPAVLDADAAIRSARSRNRAHSFGLGWSPA